MPKRANRRALLRFLLLTSSSVVANGFLAPHPAYADPIHDAAKAGDVAKIKQLLASDPTALDRRDADGKTALLVAMEAKSAEITSFLVASKADVRLADNAGMSPLLFAIAAETKALTDGNPAVAALWAAIPPVTLQLANEPLADAFLQIFAQIKIPVSVDGSLTAPVAITINGSFDLALRSVLRLARRTTGQTPTIVVSSGSVHIGLGTQQPNATIEEVWPITTSDSRYRLQTTISRPVLENFLSHAVTHMGLIAGSPEAPTPYFDDDLRMLTHIGAKFIGRAACAWAPPPDDEAHFRLATERARRMHQADPEIILEGCIFETAYRSVEAIPIPNWVFTEFHLPVEKRNFRYEAMLYGGGKYRDHWMHDASVPDMSKRETQMWFFYRGRRYIDAGCESLHFGQIALMNQADAGHVHWRSLLHRIRRYGQTYGRRQVVLCSSNPDEVDSSGRLMFDFHCWPLRPVEVKSAPGEQRAELRLNYGDSIYRNSLGGITPSGWSCDSLPYLVEFDNCSSCGKQGQPGLGLPWVWGYEEISWFAHQSEPVRNAFLRYAHKWIQIADPAGHLQPATRRVLADGVPSTNMYQANRKSDACPTGFNQEDTIREIFAAS